MSSIVGSRVLAIALPVGAVMAIALALLWTIDAIPRVPVASEVVGLLAVLLAPGIATEPAFHGGRWTLVERLGLSAALSLATVGLVGVGLQLVGLPVSPPNVLGAILVVTAPIGALSMRFRTRRSAPLLPRHMRTEVAVGVASFILLTVGFAATLALRPAPDGPHLEIMAVDEAGRLVTMPILSTTGGTTVSIAVRSVPGAVESASLEVGGDGVHPWSASAALAGGGAEWTVVEVPIATNRTGALVARVTVRGGGAELVIPIALEVGP